MKNKDIVALSNQELLDKVNEEKAALNKLKINHAVSPLENPLKLRTNRRTIAKLLTEASKRKASNK
ncbi:MAG: 50S ribosomal protein L29 [Sediminibacterium sp.]|nr:50S ribosomal protein L29 [Sediminibacterium sp.]